MKKENLDNTLDKYKARVENSRFFYNFQLAFQECEPILLNSGFHILDVKTTTYENMHIKSYGRLPNGKDINTHTVIESVDYKIYNASDIIEIVNDDITDTIISTIKEEEEKAKIILDIVKNKKVKGIAGYELQNLE